MARIENKHLKIFALDAVNNGVFGSAADNTKILSSDVETLQSKPAWELGWDEAVIGTRKFPTLEEFQSCNYINTHFVGYLLQEGIPEWNEDKTYYQNSIVKKTGTYEIYGSITDNNTGNLLTDDTNWEFLQDLGQSYQQATTTLLGIAMLATTADVIAKDNEKIVTPNLLNEHGFITGDIKHTTRTTLQEGWVWGAGTIGNAASGATYAAADAEALFTLYWNATEYNYTGATATGAALQVLSSAGANVAKGASAALDWAANRRITVPDFRDRVVAGRGNMVGNAGRLSGQPSGVNGNGLGNAGGAETNTLTIAEMPEHTHDLITSLGYGRPASGAPDSGVPIQVAPAINPTIAYNDDAGGGEPHNNVQPTIICNVVIKL